MITSGLYYRLCLIQGVCLIIGFGLPGGNQAVFTLLGTWGLLAAATGLILLRQMRVKSSRQTRGSVRPSSSQVPSTSCPPVPVLTLFRAEESDETLSASPEHEWKSAWRRSSI